MSLLVAAAWLRVAHLRAASKIASDEASTLASSLEGLTETWEEVENLAGAEPTALVARLAEAGRRLDAGEFASAPAEAARLLVRVGAGLRAVDRFDEARARLDEAERSVRSQLASPPSLLARTLTRAGPFDPRLPGAIREELARIRLSRGDATGALDLALASLDARKAVAPAFPSDTGVPQSLVLVAQAMIDLGDDSGAEVFLRESIDPAHDREGMPGSLRSYALAQIAVLVDVRAAFEESLRLRRDALAAIQAVTSEDDPRVARRMYEVSHALADLGPRFREESIALGARSLAIGRASSCGDQRRIATQMNNLGFALKEANRLCEAEPILLEALAMHQRTGGDERGAATIMNNIGTLRCDFGDRTGAKEMFTKSLEIRRRIFPDGHKDVSQSLLNLAWLHQQAFEFAEAVDLDREAVAVLERVTSGDDPDLAIALDDLSMALLDSKRYAEAEPLARRALAMEQRLSQGPDPRTAQTLDNLGVLLYHMDRYEESGRELAAALEMRAALVPGGDVESAEVLRHLAWLHEETRDLERAEREYRDAIAIHRRVGSPPHRYLEVSNDLADCLRKARRSSAAHALYRDGATAAIANLPECAWILADAVEGLASTAGGTRGLEGVEELLVAAARAALETPRMPLFARARTVHALCDWYTASAGRAVSRERGLAEARAWQRRLDEADERR